MLHLQQKNMLYKLLLRAPIKLIIKPDIRGKAESECFNMSVVCPHKINHYRFSFSFVGLSLHCLTYSQTFILNLLSCR